LNLALRRLYHIFQLFETVFLGAWDGKKGCLNRGAELPAADVFLNLA